MRLKKGSMIEMNIDWTQIILAIIGLIGAVLTTVIVPYIRAKTTKQQRENIYTVIQSAVWAADQMFKASDPTGGARNKWVMQQLKNIGLDVSEEDVVRMVEEAVQELNIAQQKFIGT